MCILSLILVANEVYNTSDCLFLMTFKITEYIGPYCEHKLFKIFKN